MVREYFSSTKVELSGPQQAQAIENIKRQAKASGLTDEQVNSLDAQTLESLAQNASCDIIAMVVPMPKNSFTGVSMYVNGQANTNGSRINDRATAICRACGHKEATVRGNAFISRYYDNENSDEVVSWARIDFNGEEATANAEWCMKAAMSGGGGASGSGGSRSLSGMMNNMAGQGGIPGGASANRAQEVHSEKGYTWSQTKEDVEVVVELPKDTPKRNIDVSISYKQIKLGLKGATALVSGELEKTVEEDDCTWTRDGDTITITLTKKDAGLWQALFKQP